MMIHKKLILESRKSFIIIIAIYERDMKDLAFVIIFVCNSKDKQYLSFLSDHAISNLVNYFCTIFICIKLKLDNLKILVYCSIY